MDLRPDILTRVVVRAMIYGMVEFGDVSAKAQRHVLTYVPTYPCHSAGELE